ncbi:MAG: polysaccharide deacetylase family protein [Phycisphaerales bacterium]|nr:polysaccharide deacetylase family protein [Phycisphaerales bacterium]
MNHPIVNAMSFDIEDWFHMVEIDAVADTGKWETFPSLVERYTDQILAQLAAHETRATFFMLGWIAERYPELVRRIAEAGHELGTHSYWHRRVDMLDPDSFAEDLRRSIDVIEQASSQRVRGFRAPSFSIRPGTEWAFDVMLDCGLEYDASLFPAPRGHGGYPSPRGMHRFTDVPSGRDIPELPMSVMRVGPAGLGFTGGGYLRFLPTWFVHRGIRRLNRRGMPAVVYLHPRDFAPDCPRVPMPLKRRFKCYVGLKTTTGKLDALLSSFPWAACETVLGLDSPSTEAAA